MKEEDISSEKAMKQIQKIFKKRGTKALEMARKEILQEKIECKEAREALTYFMTEYWHDTARPALMSLVCEAVGGDTNVTTPIAVPMILISGAIDIHDDIIDQSKSKDGRPTVYGKFGKDVALLVGDALLFEGLTLLNEGIAKGVPAEKMPLVVDIIRRMFFELGDAEAMELLFRRRIDVSPKNYLHIVKKKAADVEAHTRISAILGGGTIDEIKALSEFGRLLGMLIILRDDWIDIIDLKESRHRIQNECLPLPMLYALQNQTTKPKFNSIIQKGKVTQSDLQEILKLTKETEGMKKFEKLARGLGSKAVFQIRNIKCNKERLELLVRAVLPSV